jgi:hypothetical protein
MMPALLCFTALVCIGLGFAAALEGAWTAVLVAYASAAYLVSLAMWPSGRT